MQACTAVVAGADADAAFKSSGPALVSLPAIEPVVFKEDSGGEAAHEEQEEQKTTGRSTRASMPRTAMALPAQLVSQSGASTGVPFFLTKSLLYRLYEGIMCVCVQLSPTASKGSWR